MAKSNVWKNSIVFEIRGVEYMGCLLKLSEAPVHTMNEQLREKDSVLM